MFTLLIHMVFVISPALTEIKNMFMPIILCVVCVHVLANTYPN